MENLTWVVVGNGNGNGNDTNGDYDGNIGRSHSVRSNKSDAKSSGGARHRFALSSLRGIHQPELSKKLRNLIKTENHAIGAYEQAGRESQSIASQLSEWGESTEDDAVSDISDKLGVLLAEVAEQEDMFAQNLEDSRGVLKQIRNTEASVAPTRTHKQKIQDEIQKLKYKEPESTKLVTLEQELVRAEAQSLVAEAQLQNITRQKFKEAYDLHTAAIIERAEKQILLAQQARQLINLLDDTPMVPGEERPPYAHAEAGKYMLNDAEASLRGWTSTVEPIHTSSAQLGTNAMASGQELPSHTTADAEQRRVEAMERAQEEEEKSEPPHPTMHTTEATLAS
ncbi:Sphingolipid long chain base-responsive LSP1 [Lecanosticta acicola]|uniref:Sphingolipid long chain base-responsive LSP1 n=1 Tax=Lecanosticta acicola TaxID=111012 RepID=A0AAI8Z3D5_9PEZI|nr:Sphingolipid long chain base-responsive LSP1 [Lecanosticta acicola]